VHGHISLLLKDLCIFVGHTDVDVKKAGAEAIDYSAINKRRY
jgi:hypothetical protein